MSRFRFKPQDFESSECPSGVPGEPSLLSQIMCDRANRLLIAHEDTLPHIWICDRKEPWEYRTAHLAQPVDATHFGLIYGMEELVG